MTPDRLFRDPRDRILLGAGWQGGKHSRSDPESTPSSDRGIRQAEAIGKTEGSLDTAFLCNECHKDMSEIVIYEIVASGTHTCYKAPITIQTKRAFDKLSCRPVTRSELFLFR